MAPSIEGPRAPGRADGPRPHGPSARPRPGGSRSPSRPGISGVPPPFWATSAGAAGVGCGRRRRLRGGRGRSHLPLRHLGQVVLAPEDHRPLRPQVAGRSHADPVLALGLGLGLNRGRRRGRDRPGSNAGRELRGKLPEHGRGWEEHQVLSFQGAGVDLVWLTWRKRVRDQHHQQGEVEDRRDEKTLSLVESVHTTPLGAPLLRGQTSTPEGNGSSNPHKMLHLEVFGPRTGGVGRWDRRGRGGGGSAFFGAFEKERTERNGQRNGHGNGPGPSGPAQDSRAGPEGAGP